MSHDEFYDNWESVSNVNTYSPFKYRFLITDGGETLSLGKQGVGSAQPFEFAAENAPKFDPPKWVEQSVFYQIFPDRFANGDTTNDPKNCEAWNEEPTYYNRFGGDIAGIRKHEAYLKALGISDIYFNPIFASPANHRYETADYLHIDKEFGTDAEFVALTKELKAQGIGTVLDGVFNHTAREFFAFEDVKQNGEKSSFKNWYTIHSFPVKGGEHPTYEAWAGFESMPKLNYSSKDVRNYVLNVPKTWDTKAEIAGWRLDVPNEVQQDFWPEFRKAVKADNPNRWICGEIWADGTPWLKGDQFDSIMGYQFRKATVDFVASGATKPSEYTNDLMNVYESYTPAVSRNLLNLLGSHDTERFLTVCKGDLSLLKLGALMQMTWPGTPCIYYGDELGMEGGKDPQNRRPMRWDLVKGNATLAYYKDLIAARNHSVALQSGYPVVLATDDSNGTLAFARTSGADIAIIVVNRSAGTKKVSLPLKGTLANVTADGMNLAAGEGRISFSGTQLVVDVPGKSGALLLPKRTLTLLDRAQMHDQIPASAKSKHLLTEKS